MLESFIRGQLKLIRVTQYSHHGRSWFSSWLNRLSIFQCVKPRLRMKEGKLVWKQPKLQKPPANCFKPKRLYLGFSHSSFLLLHLAHFSQVSIAPQWFIVAIHLLYSSITSRLLGNHGSSCLLLSSTEGPSVSGGRWKALRTRCCHTK